MTPRTFRNLVFKHYALYGRHNLPWRRTRDPYRILVSEVMLQQTQVERVIPYYTQFLKRFPTVGALARAPLSEVLRAWQGLGYNRRAKMLHEAAKQMNGKVPKDAESLEKLPGIGLYTARAVAAFAYNTDGFFIETNIRTAVTHHFFNDRESVTDAEVLEVLAKAYPSGRAREWYAALMDYGSYLKRSGVRINTKAKGYTKQSTFAGSNREARGVLLKALLHKSHTRQSATMLLGRDRRQQMASALQALIDEGVVVTIAGRLSLAS